MVLGLWGFSFALALCQRLLFVPAFCTAGTDMGCVAVRRPSLDATSMHFSLAQCRCQAFACDTVGDCLAES